jgi:hypothetical protein
LEVARRSSVASIADATNVLHRVPRLGISAGCAASKVLFRPASAPVIAVIRANGSLAGNSFVTRKAGALSGRSVAEALVGALRPGVEVVGVDDIADPREVLGACAQRAVGASPLRLPIETNIALAVVVELAGTMSRALVLAHSRSTVSPLVPCILSTLGPDLVLEGGLAGWDA